MGTSGNTANITRRRYGPTIREAFIASLPVLMGYETMGIAFGILVATQVPGFHAGCTALTSLFTVSGSMQFAAVEMLRNAAQYSLPATALLAFLINIRYSVYGLPFVRVWKNYPWWLRAVLILGLTDENYAIIVSSRRHGKLQRCFVSCVVIFDICYWVSGTVIGTLLGRHLPFPTEGIEFAMLALFVVILVDLCRQRENWFPAMVGGGMTALVIGIAMVCFPHAANKTLLAAMTLTICILVSRRHSSEKSSNAQNPDNS
ncbi:MAG: AzlC family ABC transporter permease [Victivallales bacterium]|nr:AzlC family ABC transporter permease [Victivallales bacterium]